MWLVRIGKIEGTGNGIIIAAFRNKADAMAWVEAETKVSYIAQDQFVILYNGRFGQLAKEETP